MRNQHPLPIKGGSMLHKYVMIKTKRVKVHWREMIQTI